MRAPELWSSSQARALPLGVPEGAGLVGPGSQTPPIWSKALASPLPGFGSFSAALGPPLCGPDPGHRGLRGSRASWSGLGFWSRYSSVVPWTAMRSPQRAPSPDGSLTVLVIKSVLFQSGLHISLTSSEGF
jgi:hypothetical protein